MIDAHSVTAIQNELLPRNASLLRAYQLVKWASQSVSVHAHSDSLYVCMFSVV